MADEPSPPPRPRRRWLRLVRRALLVIGLLLLVALLGTLAALRSKSVRGAILHRVATLLDTNYGIAFTAEDFRPSFVSGAVELEGVRFGARGAAPFATAERVRFGVDLRTLRRTPLVVRWLDAEGLRVDLGAPLPESKEPRRPGTRSPIDILRFSIQRGEVIGAPLTAPATRWLTRWSGRAVEARGSYRDGRLEARVESGEALLDRPAFGRQVLRVAGRVGYAEKQPLSIGELHVTGDGLVLSGSASIALVAGGATSLDVDLDAATRALVPGLPPGGSLRLAGRLDLPANAGRLGLETSALPGEALAPYLDAALYRQLGLAGTVADLQTDATFGPGEWRTLPVRGTASGGWRRGPRSLVRVEARLAPEPSRPLVATVAAELLAGSPGKRTLHGTLRGTTWAEPARITSDDVVAEVDVPDLARALADARAAWPGLPLDVPQSAPLQGSLVAKAHARGKLLAPSATLHALWRPSAGASVAVDAKGEVPSWNGSAEAKLVALPLRLFRGFLADSAAHGLDGTASGTVRLAGSRRGYRTHADLAVASLAMPPTLARLARGTVTSEGTLALTPFSYRGTLVVRGEELVAAPAPTSRLTAEVVRLASEELSVRTTPLAWSADLAGEARGLTVTDVEGKPADVARVDRVSLTGNGKGAADLRTLAGKLRVDASTVTLPSSGNEVRGLHLEADGERGTVRIAAFSGEVVGPPATGAVAEAAPNAPPVPAAEGTASAPPPTAPVARPLGFSSSGRIVLEPLAADLELQLVGLHDAVPALGVTARLREGVITADAPAIATAAGTASVVARIPLAALRAVPQLAAAIDALPGPHGSGPAHVTIEAPSLDSAPLVAVLRPREAPKQGTAVSEERSEERVRGALHADVDLDLAAPANSRGEVRLTGLVVDTGTSRMTPDGPLVLELAEGRLLLAPVHLRVEGGAQETAGVDLSARIDLAPAWRPGEQPLAAAVTQVAGDAHGSLDASFFNAFLEGGIGTGPIAIEARAAGPPDALVGELVARGPAASFFWPGAAIRIDAPRLALDLGGGAVTIREGVLGLNGGEMKLAGNRSRAGELALTGDLSDVHYRLEPYGVDLLLSGRLGLTAPPAWPDEGKSRLAGRLVVDRGVLRRDIDLDREVLTLLFQPDETGGATPSLLASIQADLAIETNDGVRVKNNVGDLTARWQRLTITGTLEQPVIRGRIDLDPDGLFYAYGQTVRIDRGSLTFRGDPLTDPKVDLATTTSLQDPTIARLRGASPLDLLDQNAVWEPDQTEQQGPATVTAVQTGLANYYGARLLARVGASSGLSGFTVRPTFVFDEGDPSARLTVGRDLSRNVSMAFTVDLRNAERRTYLLGLGNLPALPSLRAEGFTNDLGNAGGSLEQTFELAGGERKRADQGARLRRVKVTLVPDSPLARTSGWRRAVVKRQIKNALDLERGAPLPRGAAFGVEIDAAELLRKKGYPDPRIEVSQEPAKPRRGKARVDLKLRVSSGPHARFAFVGDRPPRALRPTIRGLYRTDFYEPISLDEMRAATVRAFRARGHLDPQVAIEVVRETPTDPLAERTVIVRSEAGRRYGLGELELAGLDDADAAETVAASFPGRLARAELAAAVPEADKRLLGTLEILGWPQAVIAGRELADGGKRLRLEITPGPRQTLASVDVVGVDGAERDELLALLAAKTPVAAGGPLRKDQISSAALSLEDDLKRRGFADATVRTRLAPSEDAMRVALAFEVQAGTGYRLAAVDLTGERFSRPAPFLREADLDIGEPFSQEELEEGRSRLFRTGVFKRVDATVFEEPNGEAKVTIALTERPRFRVGYGLRSESGEGTGAVLDLVDRNFLGRGLTLGLRTLYEDKDRSARLYLRTGGILGTKFSLESYLLRRRFYPPIGNQIEDSQEASLQVAHPLGKWTTARVYVRHRTTHSFEIEPLNPLFPFDVEERLPYLGTQIVRDTRNDPIDPHTGRLSSVDLSGSGALLQSDHEYVRTFAQLAEFRHVDLLGRHWIWAQSLRLGAAHAFRGQDLVADERFRAGGPYSVRGYDIDSLGSVESLTGEVEVKVGGGAVAVINEELRFPLPWTLTGLVFFDAGQVWETPSDASFDLAKSLGLGLRYHSPFGLLRFDAAYPLDRRERDSRYKLYVGFGNSF